MPAPLHQKPELLARLSQTFRTLGYDGASLGAISAATGLGKSSLYHYFPGGKEEMAAAVLADLSETLERDLFGPMAAPGRPDDKLRAMLAVIDAFYDGGRQSCLLERLTASADRARFQAPLRAVFVRWQGALEKLCREAGLSASVSRMRAEDALIRIEGALVLAAGTMDHKPFGRALGTIRRTLLQVGGGEGALG